MKCKHFVFLLLEALIEDIDCPFEFLVQVQMHL